MVTSRLQSPHLSTVPPVAVRPRRLLLAAIVALLAPAGPALAATAVPGQTIAGAVSWTAAGSPYVVQGWLTIASGGSLAVGAGVQVRFAGGHGITVQEGGWLTAGGTAGQPVVLTSDAATPQAGDWYHIVAEAGSHLRLTHCDLAYGGRYSNPALILRGSDAEVRNCSVHDFPGTGINIENAGNTALLADTAVTTLTGWAIYQSTMNMAPRYSNVVLAGGGVNGVVIDGDTVAGSVTLDGSAARLSGAPILMRYGTIVPAGATLRIAPGTDLRTAPGGSFEVRDGGALIAEGTAQAPILIRANTASPAAGDWYYIVAQAGSRVRLAHCDIGYGGRYSNPALIVRSSDVELRNCTLHDFPGTGINLEGNGIAPLVADTAITTLTGWAIYQSTVNMAPRYERVALSGGGVNAPVIDGDTVSGAVTLDGTAARFVGGAPIIMRYGTIVASGATLTLAAGTELRTAFGGAIDVRDGGALVAEGTAVAPIRFRANTATPTAGDWYHIVAQAGSRLRLKYCDIGYGGRYANPALILRGSDAEVRNCTLHDFAGTGINLEGNGITPTIAGTTITTTTGWALYQNTMNMAPQYSSVTLSGGGVNALVVDGSTVSGSVTLAGNAAKFTGRKPIILVNPTIVPDGATLTIAAGTELRTPLGGSFDVQSGGTLIAEGTAAAPVTFRANTATPAAGDWYYIVAQAGSHLRLKHCDIGYGGKYNNPVVLLRGADTTIDSSVIHHGPAVGVQIENAGVTPTISGSRIENNGGWAVYQTAMSMAPRFADVTLSGNGHDALLVDGDRVAGAVVLDAAGLGGAPIHLVRSATVLDGASLTLAAGTNLRIPNGWALTVASGGTLVADGTPASRVSILPDVDAPAAGYWYYIDAQAGSHLRLTDTDVRYGGRYANATVRIQTSDAKVERCTVRDSAGDGIWVAGDARPRLTNDQIAANPFGVRNVSPATFVDARFNWWGDASGPYHPALNPQGKGNAVSDRVLFVPWLEDEAGTVSTRLITQIAGPSRVSPGETVDYAVTYYAGAAVGNAVLVVTLPIAGEYETATGGGVYWPERHQVFWRLGDLEVGAEGTMAIRVSFSWGLPNGKDKTLAVLVGDGAGAGAFDAASYHAYRQPSVASSVGLSGAGLAAELAAHPELGELYTAATAQGFKLAEALQMVLNADIPLTQVRLFRPETGSYMALRRSGDDTWALTVDRGALSVSDVDGGMRLDLETYQSSAWGTWAAGAGTAAVPLAGLGAPAPITEDECRRNCYMKTAALMVPSLVSKKIAFVMAIPECWQCGRGSATACGKCVTAIVQMASERFEKALPFVGELISMYECNRDCRDPAKRAQHVCREPLSLCAGMSVSLWGRERPVYLRWECNQNMGMWALYPIPHYCNQTEECVPGYVSSDGTPCYNCWLDGPPPRRPAPAAGALCARLAATGAGCCSFDGPEVRRARDPNEKFGPAGDVLPGQLMTYRITYENEGAGRAFGVFIVDELGPHLDEATVAVAGNGAYYPETRTIIWEVGELAPKGEEGSKGEVSFTARLKSGLPGGTVVANQATVYFPSVPEETPTNTVVNVVAPVVAIPASAATQAGTPVSITLAGNDVSGTPLTFAIVEPPLYGALTGVPPVVTYTPTAGFAGQERFTFTASNGASTSRPAAVTVEISPSASDRTPPEVVWCAPAAGATLTEVQALPVAIDETGPLYAPALRVRLSETLDAATVSESSVLVADGAGRPIARSVRFDAAANEIVVSLREAWRPMGYTVTLTTAVADAAGNPLAAPYTWSFTARPPGRLRERVWSAP
jgi:hypothetical protein